MKYKVIKTTWHGGQPQAPGTILELTNSEANLPLRQGKIAEHKPAALKQSRRTSK
jgi:hypothetical protein